MSTNSNCKLIERQPGQWFYVLEDYNAPKNAWDWHEYAQAYGPFPTEAKAVEHLHRHHANPGGWLTCPYEPERKESETLKQLLDEAPENARRLQGTGGFGRYRRW